MQAAIREALQARRNGDYAIGAVLVRGDKIIARSPNRTRSKKDPTRHAEIEVMRKGLAFSRERFLKDCILYTTHEPCPMCSTAAVWVKLKGVVYGSTLDDMIEYSQAHGNKKWAWRTVGISSTDVFKKGTPRVQLVGGFLRKECVKLFYS